MDNQFIRIRDNGIVKPLNIPEDKLKELKEYIASNKHTYITRKGMIRRLIDSSPCCICGDIPSMEVSYDMQGARLIERYCESCIKKVYARE